MTEEERKRFKELNKKNIEFNENLYKNTRNYSKSLCLLSIIVLFAFIIFMIIK